MPSAPAASLPSLVVHADWGSSPRKRWMARATLASGRYSLEAPEPVGEPSTLPERLRAAAGRDAPILVGFDFPIGLPAAYARRAGVHDFLALLPRLGEGEWSDFYTVADRPGEIGLRRPFYPHSGLPKGSKKQRHLLDGLGVASMDELRRRCDMAYPGRPQAEAIFWTLGPKAVGKATILGWKEVLAPALSYDPDKTKIWPFDGSLLDLLKPGYTVIAETYPAEFYRHLGIASRLRERSLGKRSQTARRGCAEVLLRWADSAGVRLSAGLRDAILDGFGASQDAEDCFDAAVGLCGMLNVVLGRRASGEPEDPVTRRVEGWMLGSSSHPERAAGAPPDAVRMPHSRSSRSGPEQRDEPPVSMEAIHRAEYDPLADLYDLEYSHDHDVPFWLALARREGGPVVEWGAGTGRIAVRLARAGFSVTAVELSRAMVEAGRKKDEAVEWVCGDMRNARLPRRYRLAVCAFNSFLCLTSVDDALAFLRTARDHLEPGGLLGIEVSAFAPEELADPPGGPQVRHDFTRGPLDRMSVSRYDPAAQLLHMRLLYDIYAASGEMEIRRAHDLRIRVTSRDELCLMLRLAGFAVESVYGGFEGEPFAAGSDHLIVLARPGRSGAG